MNIVLGSGSPRRKQLLNEMGYTFRIEIPNIEEKILKKWPVQKVAENLASLKANSLLNKINSNETVICADTVVICNSEILGKPKNHKDAFQMLKKLSGQNHTVITGVAISNKDKNLVFSEKTNVSFNEFEDNEINYYVNTYTPLDKAGSYGIQEWIGLIGVSKIIGSYTNVMGLPTARLHTELKGFL